MSQNIKGVSSTFTFDRDRLLSASVDGSVAGYTYAPFGRLETVSGEGKIVERDTYDGFDHVVESSKPTESGGSR